MSKPVEFLKLEFSSLFELNRGYAWKHIAQQTEKNASQMTVCTFFF